MKAVIVYYSGTGNTQTLANLISQSLFKLGILHDIFDIAKIKSFQDISLEYDLYILGCPAMGFEELEKLDFRPLFDYLLPNLLGKNIALFGSYSWGNGEWMTKWEQEVLKSKAKLIQKGLIIKDQSKENDYDKVNNFVINLVRRQNEN